MEELLSNLPCDSGAVLSFPFYGDSEYQLSPTQQGSQFPRTASHLSGEMMTGGVSTGVHLGV